MSVAALRSLEKQFLIDPLLPGENALISAEEAKALLKAAEDRGGVTPAEKQELSAILTRNRDKMDAGAKEVFESYLGVQPPTPPANSEVIRGITGSSRSSFEDDTVFLGRDGTVHGESDVPAYTRGYDATKEGPLRFRHGSPAPASTVLQPADHAAVRERTPGQALDAAAKIFGARVNGYERMANSRDFFNPNADYWWGKCHAWAWAALSATIDKLVDVPGPNGQKGLWIAGEWMSRADLGNWMMAVADSISVRDGNQLFDSDITGLDLLKGTTQFLMNKGGGMTADIFNDAKKGRKEVWNQPFVSSDVTSKTLSGSVASQLLALAKEEDHIADGVSAKLVTVVGTYGTEAGDDHESDPTHSSKTWNMYAICDSKGKVLTTYMADDEAVKNVTGLPTKSTDDLPEYIWKPTLRAIEDTLAGRTNYTVEADPHAAEFKFFINTVLKKGVPATTRTAFEQEVAAVPAGAIDSAKAAELAQKYGAVANAYSPAQWKQAFGARGLDARAFGATWPN